MHPDYSRYETLIRKDTLLREDITPLLSAPGVFQDMIYELARPFQKANVDKVVALEAMGYIIGTAVAAVLKKGLVIIRKAGKLPQDPSRLVQAAYTDYSGTQKVMEMSRDSIRRGEKVLVVDEWIQTGGSMRAALSLLEQAGAIIRGIAVIGLELRAGNDIYERYKVHWLLTRTEAHKPH